MFESKDHSALRVLVTGAASGIGAVVAATLEKEGHKIVRADLHRTSDVQQLDVGDPL